MAVVPAIAYSMVVPASLDELVTQSDLIVYGRVVGVESHWNPDRTLFTDITIFVKKVVRSNLRDPAGGKVTLRFEGGQIGGQEMRTSVAPELNRADEGIFFLARMRADKPFQLVGLSQGFIPVARGAVQFAGSRQSLDDFLAQISSADASRR